MKTENLKINGHSTPNTRAAHDIIQVQPASGPAPAAPTPSPAALRDLTAALEKILLLPESDPVPEPEPELSIPRRPELVEPALEEAVAPPSNPLPFPDDSDHTRNGKIAHLPPELREHVNEMLRSGHRYADISTCLEKLGHPGISPNNISAWKHGGFTDWLNQQHRLENSLALPKALEHCTRSGEIDRIQQNAVTLACDKIMLIMAQFDADRALDLLYHKPQFIPSFISSLATLARATADLAKAFDLTQKRERSVRKKLKLPTNDLENDAPAVGAPKSPASSTPDLDEPVINLEFNRSISPNTANYR